MFLVPKLPSVFTRTAIIGIQWRLDPSSSLLYTSNPWRSSGKSGVRGATTAEQEKCDVLKSSGVLDNISELVDITSNDEQTHFERISLALLLVGYTDEYHNLTTPLSLTEDIHFAHGPSVSQHASPAVRAYSSYTHSLVHRREALNVSEFGMVGFANAHFCSNAVDRAEGGFACFPHREWRHPM